MNNINLIPWAEKYRPKMIKDIKSHKDIISLITTFFDNNKLSHTLLYGPPGTGKTSSIVTISKHYYGDEFENSVLMLNASEERGIDTVRTKIKQFVTTESIKTNDNTPKFKLVILDEVDAMTDDAQAILRKIIEKYVNNARFCCICNYLQKINPAIISRCNIFRFKPIPYDVMVSFVNEIVNIEFKNLIFDDSARNIVINKSNGDMRKILNILQSIYMYFNNKYINDTHITDYHVSKILSFPSYSMVSDIFKNADIMNMSELFNYVNIIMNDSGISLAELIEITYSYINDIIINNKLNKKPIEYYINILKHIAVVNENIVYCNNENIQLQSFISIFYI